MGIYIGNNKVINRYVGNNKVIRVYQGTNIIFDISSSEDIPCDDTLSFEFNGNELVYKLNGNDSYTATSSPYSTTLDETKITRLSNAFSNTTISTIKLPCLNNVLAINGMFSNCLELKEADLNGLSGSTLENTLSDLFYNCVSLEKVKVDKLNVNGITQFYSTFQNCFYLESLDLTNWITTKLINMNSMFEECNSLTTLDLSSFNTSNVRNLDETFKNCKSLRELNLSTLDFTSVTSSASMFLGCDSLERVIMNSCNCKSIQFIANQLNLGGVSYNVIETDDGICEYKPTNNTINFNWETGLTPTNDIQYYFNQTSEVADTTNSTRIGTLSAPIYNYRVGVIASSNQTNAFLSCVGITEINQLPDLTNVTNLNSMFSGCENLRTVNFNNQNIELAYDSNGLSQMFQGCELIEKIYAYGCSSKTIEGLRQAWESSSLDKSFDDVIITD